MIDKEDAFVLEVSRDIVNCLGHRGGIPIITLISVLLPLFVIVFVFVILVL
jgi:hypothetical protein